MANFDNVSLTLKTCKETFKDSESGRVHTFDVFYVELPALPGIKLKLKPKDSTCKTILASALGLSLEN